MGYMREYWVAVGASPIVYRYIDWSITVPLQMIEFNLILKAAKAPIGAAGFWKLLVGTVLMLTFGYCGEVGVVTGWMGFILGTLPYAASSEALNIIYNIADFVNKIAFVL